MIQADLLHVYHLGIARDIIASTLVLFIKDRLIFGGAMQAARLQEASTMLKNWARTAKLPLKLKRLTKRKLGWDSKTYPEFKGPGFDAFVVLRWLLHVVESHPDDVPVPLHRALWCAGPRAALQRDLRHVVFENYMEMVHRNLNARRRLFRLRPKFHLMT